MEGAITDDARKRLEILQRFAELGSGFSIASHDLELRGGGDILGPEQSGHISAVGYELFMELLDEEIREIKRSGNGQSPTTPASKEPEIKTPFPAFLPESYIPDIPQRLSLYRKLSAARSEADVGSVEEELQDRFGPLGAEAKNLLWLIRIKVLLKKHRIESLTVGDGKVTLLSAPKGSFDADKVIGLLATDPARYQLTPDSRLVARISTVDLMTLSIELEALFKRIAS
jgi:transcription-repair coupling factor (superfamily II helicase)